MTQATFQRSQARLRPVCRSNALDEEVNRIARWTWVVGRMFCVCGHDFHDHTGGNDACRFCKGCKSYLAVVWCC